MEPRFAVPVIHFDFSHIDPNASDDVHEKDEHQNQLEQLEEVFGRQLDIGLFSDELQNQCQFMDLAEAKQGRGRQQDAKPALLALVIIVHLQVDYRCDTDLRQKYLDKLLAQGVVYDHDPLLDE